VANGGTLDGVSLLSPSTVDLIFREQSNGVDLVLGLPLRFGIGYGLTDPETFAFLPSGRVCHWGGWGGSVIIVDVERHLTIAYVMNKMAGGLVGDLRGFSLVTAAYEALGL
jgi:CubicO group peptidase (beta-lactamase class C family)